MKCQYCDNEYKTLRAVKVHEYYCKSNPNGKTLTNHKCNFKVQRKEDGWECSVCHLILNTKRELKEHRKSHSRSSFKIKENRICQFCGLQRFTTKEGMTYHEKYCTSNPNRCIPHSHPVSEDVKKRISEKQKENYKGRSRFNIDRSQEPYSEKYFREWLDKENIEYKKNFHVDRFFLDFAFPDKKLYFEVNGEQHYRKMYNGRDYRERDKERADILTNFGWVCLATIRWAEFRALQISERNIALDKLKHAIQTSTVVDFEFSYIFDSKYKKSIKREEAIKLGKVNSLGRVCSNKITDEEMNFRKEAILSSGVDLSKFGWVEKVSNATGLTRRQIYKIVNSTDLINYVYRR